MQDLCGMRKNSCCLRCIAEISGVHCSSQINPSAFCGLLRSSWDAVIEIFACCETDKSIHIGCFHPFHNMQIHENISTTIYWRPPQTRAETLDTHSHLRFAATKDDLKGRVELRLLTTASGTFFAIVQHLRQS